MKDFDGIIDIQRRGDRVRISLDDESTGWIACDDAFLKRIRPDEINPACPERHISHEIRIRNVLDDAMGLLDDEKYGKAIGRFDEVLFYDDEYVYALIGKSRALRCQGHFVKSLRYYRRAAKLGFEDVEYYRTLLKQANGERDAFPKIKHNIYAGDEFFTQGKFQKAVESYDRALANPSGFRDKILFKLLNKKGCALMKLENFEEALECFTRSLEVKSNDRAHYGKGRCEFELELEPAKEFRRPLKIGKKLLLDQALILYESGLFEESLTVCDVLFDNHFRADDFYFRMLEIRTQNLMELHMDLAEVRGIFEKLGN